MAIISKPLYDLLKDDVKFRWLEQHTETKTNEPSSLEVVPRGLANPHLY